MIQVEGKKKNRMIVLCEKLTITIVLMKISETICF